MTAVPQQDDAVPWPQDAVEVARIGEAWGVKGWFRVIPFASDPQAIFSSRRWYLKPPEPAAVGARPPAAIPELLRIREARSHADGAVAQAHDVESRDAAERLRGARVFVPRSSFPTESADEYYWVDLIGLDVVNREGETLGVVLGLIDTGPQSVLRVGAPAQVEPTSGAATERLIPFVAAYVDSVNLNKRRITVDWRADF
jgi:16S rRNA processing protein RimM